MFFIWFDIGMAAITFFLGLAFFRSKGKGADFLSGYNMRSKEERKQFDEEKLCHFYGKRMMWMAVPFMAGAAADCFLTGIGCLGAWIVWLLLFVLLLRERTRRERIRGKC